MEFIIQLYANNEIRLKVQTEAAHARRPVDKAADRQAEHRSILLEERGDIRRTLRNNFDKPIGYSYFQEATAWQLATDGSRNAVAFKTVSSPVYPQELLLAAGDARLGYDVNVYNRDDLLCRERVILDITKKTQRPPSHWSWGKAQRPKTFGSNARHRILESGAAIDQEKPRSSTYELTLTLPGSTPEAIEAVARWSGWIVNRQLQYIRRRDATSRPWWFFVWEFQKRGAHHQHWCVAADTPEEAYNAALDIKKCWFACLAEILEKEGIDCFARKGFGTWRDTPKAWQWHCQVIKKSVAAYFSKYCGKGSVNVRRESRYTRAGKIHYPSRWWGSSSQVKLAVKQWRLEAKVSFLSRDAAEELRTRMLGAVDGLELTRSYEYAFDIKGQDIYCRNTGKNRYVSYCHGDVWVLYVKPDRFPSIWEQFRDIIGTPAERSKGDTLMQSIADWSSSDSSCDAYSGPSPEYA